MRNKPIEFVECKSTTSYVLRPDAYRFNPDRPAQWLQRFCFWTLRKLYCHDYQEEVAYTRHIIHPERVFDRILRTHKELLERNYQEPYILYIGAGTFKELMDDDQDEMREIFRFAVSYNYSDNRGHHQIMGMEIRIIPWMEGLVGVPKKA